MSESAFSQLMRGTKAPAPDREPPDPPDGGVGCERSAEISRTTHSDRRSGYDWAAIPEAIAQRMDRKVGVFKGSTGDALLRALHSIHRKEVMCNEVGDPTRDCKGLWNSQGFGGTGSIASQFKCNRCERTITWTTGGLKSLPHALIRVAPDDWMADCYWQTILNLPVEHRIKTPLVIKALKERRSIGQATASAIVPTSVENSAGRSTEGHGPIRADSVTPQAETQRKTLPGNTTQPPALVDTQANLHDSTQEAMRSPMELCEQPTTTQPQNEGSHGPMAPTQAPNTQEGIDMLMELREDTATAPPGRTGVRTGSTTPELQMQDGRQGTPPSPSPQEEQTKLLQMLLAKVTELEEKVTAMEYRRQTHTDLWPLPEKATTRGRQTPKGPQLAATQKPAISRKEWVQQMPKECKILQRAMAKLTDIEGESEMVETTARAYLELGQNQQGKSKEELTILHCWGIFQERISVVRERLEAIGIKRKKILNISYLGEVTELIIPAKYADECTWLLGRAGNLKVILAADQLQQTHRKTSKWDLPPLEKLNAVYQATLATRRKQMETARGGLRAFLSKLVDALHREFATKREEVLSKRDPPPTEWNTVGRKKKIKMARNPVDAVPTSTEHQTASTAGEGKSVQTAEVADEGEEKQPAVEAVEEEDVTMQYTTPQAASEDDDLQVVQGGNDSEGGDGAWLATDNKFADARTVRPTEPPHRRLSEQGRDIGDTKGKGKAMASQLISREEQRANDQQETTQRREVRVWDTEMSEGLAAAGIPLEEQERALQAELRLQGERRELGEAVPSQESSAAAARRMQESSAAAARRVEKRDVRDEEEEEVGRPGARLKGYTEGIP